LKSKDVTDGATEGHELSVEHKPEAVAIASASTQTYVPPAKKYSVVKINKAFLKQQQTSANGTPSSTSSAPSNKQTSAIGQYMSFWRTSTR